MIHSIITSLENRLTTCAYQVRIFVCCYFGWSFLTGTEALNKYSIFTLLCKTFKRPRPHSAFTVSICMNFAKTVPTLQRKLNSTPPCPSPHRLYVRCSCRLWLHPLHPLNVPLQDGEDSCENLIIFLVHILPSFSLVLDVWAASRPETSRAEIHRHVHSQALEQP